MVEGLVAFEKVRDWEDLTGSGECGGYGWCAGRYDRQYRRVLLSTRTRLRSREQVGWRMVEGLVAFEKVRDWEANKCQRHICEIQGLFPAPKMTDLCGKRSLS